MKPKAKTIIEKHGFSDPDRKDSKHDTLQLWVYNNLEEVLSLFTPGPGTRKFQIESKRLERPLVYETRTYKSIVGFIDLSVSGTILNKSDDSIVKRFEASIEIKTSIESCGDLIRQINFYRRFEPYETTWIVLSPDDRFKEVLLNQGIYFFKYVGQGNLF